MFVILCAFFYYFFLCSFELIGRIGRCVYISSCVLCIKNMSYRCKQFLHCYIRPLFIYYIQFSFYNLLLITLFFVFCFFKSEFSHFKGFSAINIVRDSFEHIINEFPTITRRFSFDHRIFIKSFKSLDYFFFYLSFDRFFILFYLLLFLFCDLFLFFGSH